MKLVPISGEKLIKILNKRGFEIKRQKGSHIQLEMIPREELLYRFIPEER